METCPLRDDRSQLQRAADGRSCDLPRCDCLRSAGCSGSVNRRIGRVRRHGFTLVEFLIVISITAILTSLLLPSLSKARLAAMRLECANNLRQTGCALVGYTEDFNDRLPTSEWMNLPIPKLSETMALTGPAGAKLDGLGRLLPHGSSAYLSSARPLYCPCHHGEHPYEKYANALNASNFSMPIYANYQYRGAYDPITERRIADPLNARWILVVDGFRTRSDVNHITGTNRLHGDCSVTWRGDIRGDMVHMLPDGTNSLFVDENLFEGMWRMIDSDGMTR